MDKIKTETIKFRPLLSSVITHFILHACLLTVLIYFWHTLQSWIYLALGFFPLVAVIAYGKPIIFVQQVIIGKDKTITIRYWFGKGYTEKISKALYEVVLNKDHEIRSYRFNIQNRRFQISPCVYVNGELLAQTLKPFTKKKRLSIKPAIVDKSHRP